VVGGENYYLDFKLLVSFSFQKKIIKINTNNKSICNNNGPRCL